MLRLLSPDQYGVYALFVVVATFANIFTEAGLGSATVQAKSITSAQVSTLFWLNVLLGMATGLLAAAAGPLAAWAFGEPRLVGVALASAPMFIFGAIAAQHQALLQRTMRFRPLAIADTGSLALGAACGIHAAAIGMGHYAPVILVVATAFWRAAILWLLSGWTPGKIGALSEVRPMLGFGAGLTGASLFNTIRIIAPNAVLGVVASSSVVALFDRAYHLLVMPLERLLPPIRTVAVPTLARLQDQPQRLINAYARLLRLSLHAALPLSVLCFAAADEVVMLLAGAQWLGAVGLFRALAPLAVTQVIASTCTWLLTATGRSGVLLKFSAANAALAVASVAAGALFGPLGVAIAFSAVAVLVRTPLLIAVTTRATPVGLGAMARAGGFPLACAVVLALGLYALRPVITELTPGPTLSLVLHGTILAVAWLFLQGRAMLSEFRWLRSAARKDG